MKMQDITIYLKPLYNNFIENKAEIITLKCDMELFRLDELKMQLKILSIGSANELLTLISDGYGKFGEDTLKKRLRYSIGKNAHFKILCRATDFTKEKDWIYFVFPSIATLCSYKLSLGDVSPRLELIFDIGYSQQHQAFYETFKSDEELSVDYIRDIIIG